MLTRSFVRSGVYLRYVSLEKNPSSWKMATGTWAPVKTKQKPHQKNSCALWWIKGRICGHGPPSLLCTESKHEKGLYNRSRVEYSINLFAAPPLRFMSWLLLLNHFSHTVRQSENNNNSWAPVARKEKGGNRGWVGEKKRKLGNSGCLRRPKNWVYPGGIIAHYASGEVSPPFPPSPGDTSVSLLPVAPLPRPA